MAPPPRTVSAHRRPAGSLGQASLEYVAVLALVAVLAVTGALAATGASPPELAARLASALRHGVCVAAGGICSTEQARRAGLGPCMVHVRREGESTGALVALVRLRRGDTLQVVRRSDGSAAVAFLDDHELGLEAGVGLRLAAVAPGARADVGAGASVRTGRAYEFPSWAAARRFVARYAERETTAGEALELARQVSPLHEERGLPAPREVFYEAGTWADVRADAKLVAPLLGGVDAEAHGRLGRVLGRRRDGDTTTWYVRLQREAAASLGVMAGALGGAGAGEAVLELTTRRGRAAGLAVSGAAQLDGGLSLYGHTTDLGSLADQLRRASAAAGARGAGRQGLSLEASVGLDLEEPANRAAVDGVLAVLSGRVAPVDWDDRLRVLGHRLDAGGALDLSVYRTSSQERDSSLELSAGLGVGVERIASRHTRELVGAWSARGGALQAREDCVPAT